MQKTWKTSLKVLSSKHWKVYNIYCKATGIQQCEIDERPGINPFIYGQFTFNKSTTMIQWENEQLFHCMVLGQVENHWQKENKTLFKCLLHTVYEN